MTITPITQGDLPGLSAEAKGNLPPGKRQAPRPTTFSSDSLQCGMRYTMTIKHRPLITLRKRRR
jgi:hypothetical protein